MVKTLSVLAIAIVLVSFGDMLLAQGMKKIGAVSCCTFGDLFQLGLRIFSNPSIIIGIICLAGFFFSGWPSYPGANSVLSCLSLP